MKLQNKTLEIRVKSISSRLVKSHNYCNTNCLWDMSLCSCPPELLQCTVCESSALSDVVQNVQMYVRAYDI